MRVLYSIILSISLFSCSYKDMAKTTVAVTNLAATSGGTGSIVFNSANSSAVLTNGHVCGVVKNGGQVIDNSGRSYLVAAFKVSQVHDLCLISVSADLKYSVSISSAPPEDFDDTTVSGHPSLLPTIVSKGHFSKKMIVPILAGSRACTEEDFANPDTSIFCAIMGQVPIVKIYQAVLVSNLIQPGSSGSAVFGQDNGLSAVIFAGSGELSYGFAVPYEYVVSFLYNEQSSLSWQTPSVSSPPSLSAESKRSTKEGFIDICESNKSNKICALLKQASKYSDMVYR